MAKRRFIFFDVGNTLLFPNRARMLAPLPEDRHPTLETWQALERRTKQEFDQEFRGGKVDHGFWWTFHTYLLRELNAVDDGVRNTLVENTQNSANWDQILPGTRDALDRLRKEYRIAVISNADGRIDAVLRLFQVAGRVSEPRRDRATASVSPAQSRPTVSATMSGMLPVLSP